MGVSRDWLAVFEALRRIYTEGAYSNIAVNEAVSRPGGVRESFVRTFAKGALRDTVRLDYIIDSLAARGVRSIKSRPLIILRMGIYAIDSLDSVPAHAAVNEAVELSRSVARGSDRFINGMLRSYIRRMDEFAADRLEPHIRYSFSRDVFALLEEQYGDEALRIAEALNTPPELCLRVNTLRTTRDEVIGMLKDAGADARECSENSEAVFARGTGLASGGLYRKGLYTVQSLSSMIAVKALLPEPGQNVLDLCAAPGGKTGYMAELMRDEGSITACDIHPHRLELIEANMKRIGVTIADTVRTDASEFDPSFEERFDCVLADVPCSGLGVAAGKPEIKFSADVASFEELTEVQAAILENALRYVKPGGRVMYSTCTLNRNENESLVKHVLSKTGSLTRIVEMDTLLPYNGKVGFFYSIIRKL